MDILGSIMKNMVKPPGMNENERKLRQQQKERHEKERKENDRRIKEFRDEITARIETFASDPERDRLSFEPMDKLQRAILHDLTETAGMTAHSFGQEEVDRHVILFKEAPEDAELFALRKGEQYDPTKQSKEEEEEEESRDKSPVKEKRKPGPADYLNKYEKHLGGLSVAKDAAMSTKTDRSYGFVNSEQKRDKRTIEEISDEIRQRKKVRKAEDNN